LAVAALIGTTAITGIAAFSPRQADFASSGLAMQSRLRDDILAALQEKGVTWLILSSPEMFCARLQYLSNSSVTFSGVIGPYRCGPPSPKGYPAATLAFHLMQYQVVLQAWSSAPA